jgi:hypothetical protein
MTTRMTNRNTRRGGLCAVAIVVSTIVAFATQGCGAKAYQREHLIDPIVAFDTSAKSESRELKWLEAREGSSGGVGGAGGGCACN